MHARQHVEFAAWLAIHSPAISRHLKSLQGLEIESYWVHSKSRLERWQSALKLFDADLVASSPTYNPWPALETVIDEIFLSEVLTRVWSALLLSVDRQRGRDDFSGLVYSVFLRHLETKNRALRMILAAQDKNSAAADRLNQVRRSAEKWTDLLLSYLDDQELAAKFASDRQRLRDYVGERGDYHPQDATRRTAVLMQSLRSSLTAKGQRWGANPQLNRQIVAGILVALEHQMTESVAIPQPYMQLWIEKSHCETEALVAALNRLDNPTNRPAQIFATGQ